MDMVSQRGEDITVVHSRKHQHKRTPSDVGKYKVPRKTQTISIITLGGVHIEHEPRGNQKSRWPKTRNTFHKSTRRTEQDMALLITEAASYPARSHHIPYAERHRVLVVEVTA